MSGPSREEFAAFSDRLYKTIDDGFAAMNERLDLLNGRTGKSEVQIGKIDTRLDGLDERVGHPNRRKTDEGKGAEWSNSLTRREGQLLTVGLVIVGGMYKLIDLLGTKLWHVLMSSKP